MGVARLVILFQYLFLMSQFSHLLPYYLTYHSDSPLQWGHNERHGVSNHQPHHCLLNRLFGRRSKKKIKTPRHRGLMNSPHTWTVTRKMYPFDDVIMVILRLVIFRLSLSANIHSWQKGCYTPIEDNKTNVDRTFVFPLGWNWHDMDPWLFPNEIRHYLGQTFNARSSGIVELRNHSIGCRPPKSIFTLWQLWINICIFFQKFFWLFEQCPVQPLWVLGMRCLHLPVRTLSKVLLLPVWVWLVLPSTAY